MSRENYRKIKMLIRNEPKLVAALALALYERIACRLTGSRARCRIFCFLAPCENLLYDLERIRLEAVLDAERNPSVATRLPLKNADHPLRYRDEARALNGPQGGGAARSEVFAANQQEHCHG